MDKRRYWYFVTDQDMGEEVVLTPRDPLRKASGEPKHPRICVAPTAVHCLSAVPDHTEQMHVYRTKNKVTGYKAKYVEDAPLTKEHWLFRETKFEKVDTVNLSRVTWRLAPCGGIPGSDDYKEQAYTQKLIRNHLVKRDKRLATIKIANQRWRKE